ncbi:MAG: hypothetical protein WCJ40_06255 [Planctomycetota bacterium]
MATTTIRIEVNSCRLKSAGRLYSRQQKADQNSNNGNHHEQLNQSKGIYMWFIWPMEYEIQFLRIGLFRLGQESSKTPAEHGFVEWYEFYWIRGMNFKVNDS